MGRLVTLLGRSSASSILIPLSVSDVAAGGSIGSAATTVDIYSAFLINQTTAGKALTLATPTQTSLMREVNVSNVGSAGFFMYGWYIRPGASMLYVYVPSVGWRATVSSAQVLSQSAVQVTAPADTSENTLASFAGPGGAIGSNGALLVRASFSFTASAQAKTMRIRIGTTELARFGPGSTSASLDVIWYVTNRNSEASQIGMPPAGSGAGATANAYFTGTENTANAWTLSITGQKGNGGETLALEAYSIELRRFD